MISGDTYVKTKVFFGFFILVTGGLVLHNLPTQAVAQSTSAAGQTTDACYESIKGATKLTRVENMNSEYGYASVECSPSTGAVLWYGDPYHGTVPMEGIPQLDAEDQTAGDFAQAVIRPRTEHIQTMQCSMCHPGGEQNAPMNTPRQIMMHQDIVSDASKLQHGRGAIWCFDCHNPADRDTLVDHQGQALSFNESHKLCGSCHGDTYSEWRMGLHGKRTGSWEVGGKKRWWTCTECHDPHTVQEHRFNPVKPEPPPALPRGMTSRDHERR
jgi:uncharacterized CHY-type Zn-finger protein